MDCEGHRQTRLLPQFSHPKDGRVWSFHQRTPGPFLDQNIAEIIFRENELESKDLADSCQQFDRTF